MFQALDFGGDESDLRKDERRGAHVLPSVRNTKE